VYTAQLTYARYVTIIYLVASTSTVTSICTVLCFPQKDIDLGSFVMTKPTVPGAKQNTCTNHILITHRSSTPNELQLFIKTQ
jgi:hypothetical protein